MWDRDKEWSEEEMKRRQDGKRKMRKDVVGGRTGHRHPWGDYCVRITGILLRQIVPGFDYMLDLTGRPSRREKKRLSETVVKRKPE